MDVVAGSARQAFAVLLVFGLLGLTIWNFRKGGGPAFRRMKAARSLEATERLALTPQHAIHLIRVQGREVVIATHPHGCTVIESGIGNSEARP